MTRAPDARRRNRAAVNAGPGGRTQAAFLVVVIILAVLSVLPYWTGRRIELLRREMEMTAIPALRLARTFELSLAMQTAAARGFAISGNPNLLIDSRVAAETGRVSLERLGKLVPEMGPSVQQEYAQVKRLADEWYAVTTVRRSPQPEGIRRGLPQQQQHFESLLAATTRMHTELETISRNLSRAIVDAQSSALTAMIVLFVLAIFAAATAAWMTWRQRLLVAQVEWAHSRAQRSAEEEQALRAAAAAVAAPITTDEVVRQIARGALDATGARGAFMGRFVDPDHLEVIAVAGADAPPLGSRLTYAGTAAEQVVRSRAPAILTSFDQVIENRTTIVLPMIDSEGAMGILTLIYDPGVEPHEIGPDALARASTFADLTTVALRKARLLEESEQRRQELQRLTDSRALLMRGFSHDLKNPLWAADGFLQLLEAGVPSPLTHEQKASVQRARRSLQASFKLVHDLLDLARAGTDTIELTVAPCDVNELLREVVEEHRASAESRKIGLVLKENGAIPELQTDSARVRQVIGNLVSNGIKYTKPGGRVELTAEVLPPSADEEQPWLLVHVTDTGPGIHPEEQEAVFQEFVRLNAAEQVPGAGIGLAISQRVAHALGGRITLKSRVGIGSTFTLWLPLRLSEQAPVERAA